VERTQSGAICDDLVGGIGAPERIIGHQGDDGVDLRVHGTDAVEMRLHHFARR
jgi:hypothetical protein